MQAFIQAIDLVATPQTLLAIVMSCAFGLFVGAVPGLSATMATALLVPFTFYLDPIPAIATVIACTTMAITAGDIPAVMLRIPGTPSSAAYAEEAYAMTRKGQGSLAMGTLLVSACIGGFIGFIVLALVAPMLATVALRFSSFEYFWLAALGLSCAALVSGGGMIKSILGLLTGLAAATVGMDPLTGAPRFTLGITELSGGLTFVPAMIGLFAVGELIRGDAQMRGKTATMVGGVFKGVGGVLSRYRFSLLRGAGFGTLIGALPGAGGDLGAWIAYAFSKRFSRTPELYGKGHPEGLVEAGSCNNAALCAAWIPAMVFGIPGDAVTAIAVGVLFMKGLNPGPQLMTEHVENFYAVMLVFIIANALIIPLGWLAIRTARRLFSVPRHYLAGAILIFSIVGSYASENSLFGIVVMAGFGVLAWAYGKIGIPIAPVILGMVMGPLVEHNFLTSMIISRGSLIGFFERPISAGLGVLFIVIWMLPVISMTYRRFQPSVPKHRI